jgi:hypothetical protein
MVFACSPRGLWCTALLTAVLCGGRGCDSVKQRAHSLLLA